MSDKTVVILQSNYIPWKGYFDLINLADEFIFYDEVQYTRLDWRNRNKIKTATGPLWLSIPVGYKQEWRICEVEMKNQHWKARHKKTIAQNYSKAPYFQEFKFILDYLYDINTTNLSEYNQHTIRYIAEILEIKVAFSDSRIYSAQGSKTEKLIDILKKASATCYITGPSAKNYLEEELFKKASIELKYFTYEGYPEYKQLYSPFIHQVSVLDLIFNEGKNATQFMKTFEA